jgi:hypothetical protein
LSQKQKKRHLEKPNNKGESVKRIIASLSLSMAVLLCLACCKKGENKKIKKPNKPYQSFLLYDKKKPCKKCKPAIKSNGKKPIRVQSTNNRYKLSDDEMGYAVSIGY